MIFTITGSTFRSPAARGLIERLRPGNPVELRREPDNEADPNAIMVFIAGTHVGYVPAGLAADIASLMDIGELVAARKAAGHAVGVCEVLTTQPIHVKGAP